MSIQQNFPAISPSLSLNFARSKTLDPRITFSRTSTATRVNETGLIEVMSANEPRFDHKYENGVVKSLGLLVEEQRTNEFPDNTNIPGLFTGSATRTGVTILTPDGDANGHAMLTDASAFGTNYENHTTSGSDNEVAGTVSFYAKKKTAGTGTLTVTMEGGGVSRGFKSGAINSDTWTRVTATKDYTGSTSLSRRYDIYLQSGNSSDGDTEFYICFLQFENGSFPTSYIPTSGSTATRSPDNVSMTGTNFSDWYNQDEGTVYVSQKLKAVQDTDRNNLVYLINGGSGNDYFYNTKKGNQHIFVFGDGETSYSRFQDGTDSTDSKIAWAYDVSGDDFKPYYNGIEATNETDNNTPSATSHTQLELGATSGDKYCGHISQLTYYPRRLTNAQLQNLTK